MVQRGWCHLSPSCASKAVPQETLTRLPFAQQFDYKKLETNYIISFVNLFTLKCSQS